MKPILTMTCTSKKETLSVKLLKDGLYNHHALTARLPELSEPHLTNQQSAPCTLHVTQSLTTRLCCILSFAGAAYRRHGKEKAWPPGRRGDSCTPMVLLL